MHAKFLFAVLAWGMAALWLARILPALRMLPGVPDLFRPETLPTAPAAALPSLTVIVPAKDEAAAIEACLRSLLASDYPDLTVIAVDDRSTDGTGAVMDRIAAETSHRAALQVMHITDLPAGWLGKPHAMAQAAANASSQWVLFTDADVLFAPATLRRTMEFAVASAADHCVLYPTLILRHWTERALTAFFQSVSVLAGQPWKIPDPQAKRAYIGVGAFNLIRRPAYESLGGFAALRMEVLEDMRLGYRVKQAGYAQRVLFGKDCIRIRWAESAAGMLNNLSKNLFSVFRFRPLMVIAASLGCLLVCLVPYAALFVSGTARWAGIAVVLALILINLQYRRQTGISPLYALLLPLAAVAFAATLLRSMALVLRRGGVLWRGTLYPLKELRRNAGPLW